MRANEFVKKFGLGRTKQMVNTDDSVHALVFATTNVSFLDLKRLVDSHELVEKHGGYNSVKAMFEDVHCMDLDDWDNDLELLARAM